MVFEASFTSLMGRNDISGDHGAYIRDGGCYTYRRQYNQHDYDPMVAVVLCFSCLQLFLQLTGPPLPRALSLHHWNGADISSAYKDSTLSHPRPLPEGSLSWPLSLQYLKLFVQLLPPFPGAVIYPVDSSDNAACSSRISSPGILQVFILVHQPSVAAKIAIFLPNCPETGSHPQGMTAHWQTGQRKWPPYATISFPR